MDEHGTLEFGERRTKMKKAISIAAIVVGVLTVLSTAAPMIIANIFVESPTSGSVGIIGGADGPTAILVSQTLIADNVLAVLAALAIGVLLVIAGIWGLKKTKK